MNFITISSPEVQVIEEKLVFCRNYFNMVFAEIFEYNIKLLNIKIFCPQFDNSRISSPSPEADAIVGGDESS